MTVDGTAQNRDRPHAAGWTPVALAHDYATQRGGAERVALIMAEAFPGAPMYTTLYDRDRTFPEMADLDLRVTRLNRYGALRRDHRVALPFLARTVSRSPIDADVLLASSTGWAHGFPTDGRKIVYCHAPARWLYQRDRYLGVGKAGESLSQRANRLAATGLLGALTGPLQTWDRRAAHSADVYLANSTVTREAVRAVYDIDAEVVPPPPALSPQGEQRRPEGMDVLGDLRGARGGFILCVARLLPYKNVDLVIEAARSHPDTGFVVVGDGPDRGRLEGLVTEAARDGQTNVALLGRVTDTELRWLYAGARVLVAASYEDYGLSPLEAAAFGKPSVVLRDGGYLDTVVEGRTGVFFDSPTGELIARAITEAVDTTWDLAALLFHARQFSSAMFTTKLQQVVDTQMSRSVFSTRERKAGQ
ncbi:Glycosyltransferase involved in cell wall bisynthesis [Sanguibacter gelidistatuariae]|uniref:D-inositol 3-phosphate glycosyltransferase n=1 Tax=Sanguibacter gelidistatuariae TaxID=1814289 RepID=A0A1G6QAC3_9MICO|nr:glycosyltransferase [Sanguibacter gelidistatuariae]SDC89309.1 Glycosyltransferase involved in cell wall bisynthesis [Sanguibacter gelidistatuariae]